jgi:hypothetical protein
MDTDEHGLHERRFGRRHKPQREFRWRLSPESRYAETDLSRYNSRAIYGRVKRQPNTKVPQTVERVLSSLTGLWEFGWFIE